VAIKNAVHALPASEQSQEDFEWLLKEILEAGGEAVICEARLIDGLSDEEVRLAFNEARDSEYAEIADEARGLCAKLDEADSAEFGVDLKAQFSRLKSRHFQNVAIDFFDANGRQTVDGLIGALEEALAAKAIGVPAGEPTQKRARINLRDRVWVTRQGVHVDRIACAWLIRRFIDEQARFKFVQAKNYAPVPGELRFDMYDAEFTHQGDCCSFEVLLGHCEIGDPALGVIGEIVHDIDLKDEKFGREEAAGVKALINGICADTHDDVQRIARGAVIFDDLYGVFRKKRGLRSPSAVTKKLSEPRL
jgi:hypothetical protein